MYIENNVQYESDKKEVVLKYFGTEANVELPESVRVIDKAAFASCFSLESVLLPDNIREIKDLAFFNCPKLSKPNTHQAKVSDTAFLNCKTESLEQISINDICEKKLDFFVSNYQRGYRWTKDEVLDLIHDIEEIDADEKYCMQPLTVKQAIVTNWSAKLSFNEITEDSPSDITGRTMYELVDGQQRLTTISLLYNYLSGEGKALSYSIFYENIRDIDRKFIENALKTIEEFFKEKSKESIEAVLNKIRNNLIFIWYEILPSDNATEKFRNINDGQIILTNAELFKALLLNPDSCITDDGTVSDYAMQELFKISNEWNTLEQKLHDDSFWYFLSRGSYDGCTRIDYLLECFEPDYSGYDKRDKKVRQLLNNKPTDQVGDERFSFHLAKFHLNFLKETESQETAIEHVKFIWEQIVHIYNTFSSWYSDNDLYHNIGFLVATDAVPKGYCIVPQCIKDLLNKGDQTLAAIRKESHILVSNRLKPCYSEKNGANGTIFDPQCYTNTSKTNIYNFLLFFNVWSTNRAGSRFPFDKFNHSIKLPLCPKCHKEIKGFSKDTRKCTCGFEITESVNKKILSEIGKPIKWDIEHVRAKDLKSDLSSAELDKIKGWLVSEFPDTFCDESSVTKEAYEQFTKDFTADHSISNLVLLDSGTNRSYGNDLFNDKRKEIIERDKGNVYIPLCTRNVFLKYYTDNPSSYAAWTDEDKECYMKEIRDCTKSLNSNTF